MVCLGYNARRDCLDGKSLYQKQTVYHYDHIFDRRCLDVVYLGDSKKLLCIRRCTMDMITRYDILKSMGELHHDLQEIKLLLKGQNLKGQKFEETELTDKLRNRGFGIYTKDGVKHRVYQVLFMYRSEKAKEVPKPVAVMSMEEQDLQALRTIISGVSRFVFANWDTVYIYLD